ncbi:hypothetical protein EVAR_26952_1 [Eumeta japonica]|uniref:Uncharacterized protein n=1 Tax=Eumeta variegata TaxID=151549 RepID=A0A4C1VJK0_EUMVA|nr:hypothetical protein EVAR_26952_1 [Eumeta japonica]
MHSLTYGRVERSGRWLSGYESRLRAGSHRVQVSIEGKMTNGNFNLNRIETLVSRIGKQVKLTVADILIWATTVVGGPRIVSDRSPKSLINLVILGLSHLERYPSDDGGHRYQNVLNTVVGAVRDGELAKGPAPYRVDVKSLITRDSISERADWAVLLKARARYVRDDIQDLDSIEITSDVTSQLLSKTLSSISEKQINDSDAPKQSKEPSARALEARRRALDRPSSLRVNSKLRIYRAKREEMCRIFILHIARLTRQHSPACRSGPPPAGARARSPARSHDRC